MKDPSVSLSALNGLPRTLSTRLPSLVSLSSKALSSLCNDLLCDPLFLKTFAAVVCSVYRYTLQVMSTSHLVIRQSEPTGFLWPFAQTLEVKYKHVIPNALLFCSVHLYDHVFNPHNLPVTLLSNNHSPKDSKQHGPFN